MASISSESPGGALCYLTAETPDLDAACVGSVYPTLLWPALPGICAHPLTGTAPSPGVDSAKLEGQPQQAEGSHTRLQQLSLLPRPTCQYLRMASQSARIHLSVCATKPYQADGLFATGYIQTEAAYLRASCRHTMRLDSTEQLLLIPESVRGVRPFPLAKEGAAMDA